MQQRVAEAKVKLVSATACTPAAQWALPSEIILRVPAGSLAVAQWRKTLRAGDCVSDVDLWPHVDSSDIHEFLVRRTSFITREQLKSRKAPEGHNFVTSGWVREPSVKTVAAYTVIVVTQVNHSQSSNKSPVECSRGQHMLSRSKL
ncbi:hypothetical protein HPB50_015026 [Hyalomma asiaticum]|uniref:Uncharacterized protein n=1 Tax=Hyalomma asiaticum TaxID=266040 RepID=A0ACB7SU96_HYAAI|nr:hypothetical protein HPB50_015026 [Hyalomma asiaticum]